MADEEPEESTAEELGAEFDWAVDAVTSTALYISSMAAVYQKVLDSGLPEEVATALLIRLINGSAE